MFQVSRFGGFSNRPKNDDQSKIDALLQRLKKPQKRFHDDDDQDAAAGTAGAGSDADSAVGSDADSDSESESESGSNSDSVASGSGAPGAGGGGDGGEADAAAAATAAQDGDAPATRRAPPSALHQPAPATTFEIARAMMAGAHNRANLLRKLAPVGAGATSGSGAAVASAAAAAGTAVVGKKKTRAAARSSAERREARRARRQKAAAAAQAAQDATWACLDPSLRAAARAKGLRRWFPIQTSALPTMVAALRPPGDKARGGDFCIAAPTGSGKTLAYVLPVLQTLLGRRVVRLRALVILPTRDLALQVYGVFKAWAALCGTSTATTTTADGGGGGLRVGLVRGQAPFHEEQAMLGAAGADGQEGGSGGGGEASRVDILVATPGRLIDHLQQTPGFTLQHLRVLVIDEVDRLTRQSYQQWLGKVNAAVHAATASGNYRSSTSNTTTTNNGNNNNNHNNGGGGVFRVSTGANTGNGAFAAPLSTVSSATAASVGPAAGSGAAAWGAVAPGQFPAATAAAVAAATAACGGDLGLLSLPAATPHRPTGVGLAWTPFTRVLVSATLTTNPQRLEEMQLRRPTVFALESSTATAAAAAASGSAARKTKRKSAGSSAGGADGDGAGSDDDEDSDSDESGDEGAEGSGPKYVRVKNKLKKMFATPATLDEHMVVCRSAAERPLALLHLLNERVRRDGLQTIIFCSSVESTHRLARLLELYGGFPGDGVYEFSRNVSQNRRNEMIRGFREKRCLVLVASDSMARGMDMVQCRVVINYDAPVYVKTYIHRAGRTARAGRAGDVFTILRADQVRHFKALLRRIDNSFVNTISFDFSAATAAAPGGDGGGGSSNDGDDGDDAAAAKRARGTAGTGTGGSSRGQQPDFGPLVDRFRGCLGQLRRVVLLERTGRLRADDPVPADLAKDS